MESTGIKKSGVYQDFRASVTVTGSPALSTVTGVRITNSGDGGGKIALEENDELYSEKYHLDFNPTWQEYIFEKSRGALVIRGRSEKMGEYEFVIVPIPDSK
jgi:hypothetical protein